MTLLDEAKKLINDFCLEEYGDGCDFDNLEKIPLAYTLDENENEIQVECNLKNYSITTYLNGEEAAIEKYGTIQLFIRYALNWLSFDNLVCL